MHSTRAHRSPSTLSPAITPAPTPAPESPIAPARPALRTVQLTCRPTIGETADSLNAWTATIVWGNAERDPRAWWRAATGRR